MTPKRHVSGLPGDSVPLSEMAPSSLRLTTLPPWAVVEITNSYIKQEDPGPSRLRKVPRRRGGEEQGRGGEEQKGVTGWDRSTEPRERLREIVLNKGERAAEWSEKGGRPRATALGSSPSRFAV